MIPAFQIRKRFNVFHGVVCHFLCVHFFNKAYVAILTASAADIYTEIITKGEMDGKREDDRVLIPSPVCELSARPGHLHIHYHNHDSIIVLCGNKDLFCLAFVILINCVADSPLLIMAAKKLTTIL